jgi:hypothetical protein
MMFSRHAIANSDLTDEDIPSLTSGWDDRLIRFALSFDGYEYTASQPGNTPPGRLAAFTRPVVKAFAEGGCLPSCLSLSDLRACLFWEERRVRHTMMWQMDEKQMDYLRALLECIRAKVRVAEAE